MRSLTSLYEGAVLHNLATVQTVESGIRNITWLLPGRFEDAEVASEGLYAFLSVVSSYHDTLISRRIRPELSLPPRPFSVPAPAPNGSANLYASSPESSIPHPKAGPSGRPGRVQVQPTLPPPSEHHRYTTHWTDSSLLYKKLSRALSTLGYVELLLEMLARRRGDRFRWKIVVVLESIKTFVRLILLRLTRRPVLARPTPQRELDIAMLPEQLLDPALSSSTLPASSSSTVSAVDSSAEARPAVELLPPGNPLRTHLYPLIPSLPPSHQEHPLHLIPEIRSTEGYVAEILTSSVTLIQVLLLLRAARRHPDRSYRPLSLSTLSTSLPPSLIPLALRLLARRLRPPPADSLLLAQHYAQQDRRIISSFFLTGPVWVGWTRLKIMSWIEWLERWPLVGLVGELAEGYLPLVDNYFYYTSS